LPGLSTQSPLLSLGICLTGPASLFVPKDQSAARGRNQKDRHGRAKMLDYQVNGSHLQQATEGMSNFLYEATMSNNDAFAGLRKSNEEG
ncbi:MAG: hypothetical protein L0338_36225, partial [Acidobacteria bacterium]|nr:hypothetical protein [Acidobacteriota bacterium]